LTIAIYIYKHKYKIMSMRLGSLPVVLIKDATLIHEAFVTKGKVVFLFIIYYLLFIIYYLLFIIYYLLFIIYYLLFIIYYLFIITCF
jgi:hypothetical protein